MSEVSRNVNAYTIQEENSTAYCTPRRHPGETPTAGPRFGRHNRCNPLKGSLTRSVPFRVISKWSFKIRQ